MKVYVMVDMEGASCIVRPEQAGWRGYEGWEYHEGRRLLTGDVNAAVEGAFEGGAVEIVVDDTHGGRGGWNIIPEELHPEVECAWVDHGSGLRLSALDSSFNCVFLVGYHAMAGNLRGVLTHTFSSQSIYRVMVNGIEVGEIAIDSAIAGSMGVPVALITGCSEAVEEARRFLGEVEAVPVKKALGRNSALCFPPRKSRYMIREAARRAVRRMVGGENPFKPFKFEEPVEVVVEYTHPDYADRMERMKGVERLGSRTVICKASTFVEAARALGWLGRKV